VKEGTKKGRTVRQQHVTPHQERSLWRLNGEKGGKDRAVCKEERGKTGSKNSKRGERVPAETSELIENLPTRPVKKDVRIYGQEQAGTSRKRVGTRRHF